MRTVDLLLAIVSRCYEASHRRQRSSSIIRMELRSAALVAFGRALYFRTRFPGRYLSDELESRLQRFRADAPDLF